MMGSMLSKGSLSDNPSVKAWKEEGRTGFKTCRFFFERLPGQPPIPTQKITAALQAVAIKKKKTSAIPAQAPAGPSKPQGRVSHIPKPPFKPDSKWLEGIKTMIQPKSKLARGTRNLNSAGPSTGYKRSYMESEDGYPSEDEESAWSAAGTTSDRQWGKGKVQAVVPLHLGFKKRKIGSRDAAN
ncbi:hypothetical protein H0H81_007691 [Sphagnurus paluster]|uniref:Uncharacterized protein n=1 Tax=Sphagnurus paluster TaxID=117069 RepID=A0A9P7KLM2_9AGAR|nr:hypothetical protein H0H81_007691 [Sphagnurus paluster]